MIALGMGVGVGWGLRSSVSYLIGGASPALVFDMPANYFRTGGATTTFSDATTFARAGNATYVDATGTMQTASANVPRQNHHIYNGTAWVNAGLLVEPESATNLVTYSEDFTNASWGASNTATLAIDAAGPDGETSAVTLVDNNAGGSSFVRIVSAGISVSTSTAYTASIYAKADQLSYLHIRLLGFTTPTDGGVWFDLATGTVGTENTGCVGGITDVGGGYFRCSVTFTTDATDTAGQVLFYVCGADNVLAVDRDGTSSILIYGAQLEASSVPTSYIPTSGATATRAAETLVIPAANLPDYTAAVSIQMDGFMTYADTGTLVEARFLEWKEDASNYITTFLDTRTTLTGRVSVYQNAAGVLDVSASAGGAYSPGVLVPFNIASRHGTTFVNNAVSGTGATANTTPTAIPDLSGSDLDLTPSGGPMIISKFRMWGEDLTDVGIAEASA